MRDKNSSVRKFFFRAFGADWGGVSLIPPSAELKIKLGGVSSGLRPDAFLLIPPLAGYLFPFFSLRLFLQIRMCRIRSAAPPLGG